MLRSATAIDIALIFFVPVFGAYLRTGTVDRFPTLIVCGFTILTAIMSIFTGLILENVRQKSRRDFEMTLNGIPSEYTGKRGAA